MKPLTNKDKWPVESRDLRGFTYPLPIRDKWGKIIKRKAK